MQFFLWFSDGSSVSPFSFFFLPFRSFSFSQPLIIGSASYIVREVRSERERERERDTETDGSDVTIVALKLAMSLHFPLPKIRTFRFSLANFRFSLFKWSPLWRWNGTYAKVRDSQATALLRGKSIHPLYESLWFVPCLPVVFLLLKRFFSSLARFAGSPATHTLRKNICWFFSWWVTGEGPELLDAEGHSSIAPLCQGACRTSKSQSF